VLKANFFEPVDWKKYLPGRITDEMIEMNGELIRIVTGLPGATYNSALAPMKPTTLEDFLKPQWKGKIASTPYAAGFNFLAAFDPKWGPERMEDFVTKLAAQVGGLIRCGDTAPLLSGQFDMLVLECDISDVIQQQRRGAPLAYVVPADAPVMDLWYMAIPKTAKDPAAGALLALFMLTKGGQAISWESDANDLALLPGSKTLANLPGDPDHIAGAHGAQDFVKHPETLQMLSTYVDILRKGAGK